MTNKKKGYKMNKFIILLIVAVLLGAALATIFWAAAYLRLIEEEKEQIRNLTETISGPDAEPAVLKYETNG